MDAGWHTGWRTMSPGQAVGSYFIGDALHYKFRFAEKGTGRKVSDTLWNKDLREQAVERWSACKFESVIDEVVQVVHGDGSNSTMLRQRLAANEHAINARLLHALGQLGPEKCHRLFSALLGSCLTGTRLELAALPKDENDKAVYAVQDDGFLINDSTLIVLELKVVNRDTPHRLDPEQFWKYMGLLSLLRESGRLADHVEVHFVALGPRGLRIFKSSLCEALGVEPRGPDSRLSLNPDRLAQLMAENWSVLSKNARQLAEQVIRLTGAHRLSYEGVLDAVESLVPKVDSGIVEIFRQIAHDACTKPDFSNWVTDARPHVTAHLE